MELGRQAQGGGFLKEFGADEEMGRLTLANIKSFLSRTDRSGQMAILSKALGQDGAKGGVGIDDQDASRMAAIIILGRLCHGDLDLSLNQTVSSYEFNTFIGFSQCSLPRSVRFPGQPFPHAFRPRASKWIHGHPSS
jgi:hypothetical protein